MNLQLYSLLFARFTMRFIPLIFAAATATLFNVYAYAKPVMASSLDTAQLEKARQNSCNPFECNNSCVRQGYITGSCLSDSGYVQIPSNKFVLRLTT